ncbi:hypothetical protein BASA81_004775 [Batrachochytrium salamandrivorans]|nr:hypothetical protein BASA81_004775 [Batrachochytrium salamandrivorans]
MRFGEQFGKRILISSKRPRLETEALKLNLSGRALDRELELRGFNVPKLHKSNEQHQRALDLVQCVLASRKLDFFLEYTKTCLTNPNQADMIICLGGDGTLLETCQFVHSSETPVLGVNSDPGSSVGKLLSVDSYWDFSKCWERIETGRFDWLMRSRIGCDLIDKTGRRKECEEILALNEVLLAEREVCRPSRHSIWVDGEEDFGVQRSCGLLVATGSGSTAWIHSANAIHPEDAQLLLNCTHAEATLFAKRANEKMALEPTSRKMSYFIREILSAETGEVGEDPVMRSKRRGFAQKLRVLALGFDTCIFQDGLPAHRSVQLEHGTVAEFAIARGEKSLRTFAKF